MSLPSTQKALLLPRCGPDAAYAVGERPVPQPGPGQVLIRNVAVALNPLDVGIRTLGLYVSEQDWPTVAGWDGAGTIAVLGPNVQTWAVGDVVMYQGWAPPDYGTFQEYTLAEAELVSRVPGNISIEEATTIPSAYATAVCPLYNTLSAEHALGLTPPWDEGGRGKYAGQAALVIGGSGSVGQLTLQMLKLSGFSPIITTASSSNEAYCKSAGATHVIDYHTTSYDALPDKVAELLNGAPLALAVDAISVPESQKASWSAIAPGAKLVLVLPSVLEVELGKPEKESGKTVVMAHAVWKSEENLKIAARACRELPGLVESGDVKPNHVEVLPGGLKGINPGVDRLEAKKVSGAKLVVHPQEGV
ncbi:unnamed protein product [Peniophora sp. CBMAI 1063]|nr:unnamed protein product [Peniophora sp. CBMAI 1063]